MSDTTVGGLTIHDYGQQVDGDEARARKDLEERYGDVFDTQQLREKFVMVGFAAPYAVVMRIEDGQTGSIEFTHNPRFYFNFVADRKR